MPPTFNPAPGAAPLPLSDVPVRMAKAGIREAENAPCFRAAIGTCLDTARRAVGWSLKEFARELARDERQVARWISGAERPQMDVLFGVEQFRAPLLIALASLSPEITIETTLTYRKSA